MISHIAAFAPGAATVNLSATSTSDNVQFQEARNSRHIRVHNYGPDPVWIEFGDEDVEADTDTSMPMPAGSVEVFSCTALFVAAVTDGADTSTVYITAGEGI